MTYLAPTVNFFREDNMYKIISILAALCIFISTPVMAIELSEAKQQGLVGEMPNGYLGLVVHQTDAEKLVAEINQQRKTIYQQLAEKNNISIEQVEALAGQKAFSKTQTGHYLYKDGSWVKK